MFNLIVTAALATLNTAGADADARHRVAIDHAGKSLTAVYEPQTTIRTKQVGTLAPNRPNSARCLWTAEVSVARHLEQSDGSMAPGAHRVLAPAKQLEGSFAGRCSHGERQVERALAARDDEVSQHVLAVAAQDRAALLAELETAGQGSTADM